MRARGAYLPGPGYSTRQFYLSEADSIIPCILHTCLVNVKFVRSFHIKTSRHGCRHILLSVASQKNCDEAFDNIYTYDYI